MANKNQILAAKISAKIKINNTIDLILRAKKQINDTGVRPTQKIVSEVTGLSLITIKRNWRRKKYIINDN